MTISHRTTRGGKYEIKLIKDADGTYSVRCLTRGEWRFCSVGYEHLEHALREYNKTMYLHRYFNKRNYCKEINA